MTTGLRFIFGSSIFSLASPAKLKKNNLIITVVC